MRNCQRSVPAQLMGALFLRWLFTRRAGRTALAIGFCCALSGSSRGGPTLDKAVRERPLLLGGPVPLPAPAKVDPRLPTGPEALPRPRPGATRALCSDDYPVCIQLRQSVKPDSARNMLGALERAYQKLVFALGLPVPRADDELGGSGALDWYVEAGTGPTLSTYLDTPKIGLFDSASLWCTSSYPGPELQRNATLCVAEAIAARLDAALPADIRRAYAVHLWWTVGNPTGRDLQAINDFQRTPARALFGRAHQTENDPSGSALFFEYLDTARGRGMARLSTSLIALSCNQTAPDRPRFNNEPDIFDVLRHSLGNDEARYAELLGDFMIHRAFLGTRDDGTHFQELAWTSDLGRARFDWVLPFSSLPRRVALKQPVDPTGAVYLWVDLDEVALGDTLGFQATWEPPVNFAWSLVRVGKDGHELSRLHVPHQQRATQVEQRLVQLESAGAVLIVGTNLGGVDLTHPFDPDLGPFEPHGAVVYLVKL